LEEDYGPRRNEELKGRTVMAGIELDGKYQGVLIQTQFVHYRKNIARADRRKKEDQRGSNSPNPAKCPTSLRFVDTPL
jgi:hypothetical protein